MIRTRPIKLYPDNGKHIEVITDMPFYISKGEDPFYYYVGKKEMCYNGGDKTTTKWLCRLTPESNISLRKIFEIKVTNNVENAYRYCKKMYIKSLKMELERICKEIEKYENSDI